ncbi:uncharacterized protein E0L32_009844 [Thyridium curvatum]|uniref:Uncharacterized protein n=1 Tax=Thyridium curvatum TaxID=1093900 RepID=A0A507AG42_9PEZI|nr:uncharacterized protein E0L32_009844 [Thyridium curvatum]TPX08655.1 hypothetical protein E0L32_009844 [Thyridium curvatum]
MLGFEKSEDLLQGLLVHLAFYQYHLRPQRQQMLLITQLCVNLVYDLGLDDLRGFRRGLQKEGPQSGVDICNRATEARLLLGAYYLAAVYTNKLKKRSIMPHTKKMTHAAVWLAEQQQYPTDGLIQHLVATQELSRRIHDTFSYDSLDNAEPSAEAITFAIVKSFFQEVDRLEKVVPSYYKNNGTLERPHPTPEIGNADTTKVTLAMEFPAMRAMAQEATLYELFWTTANSSQAISPTRANLLWESIQSYKSFVSGLTKYDNDEAFYLTFATFSKLCSVLAWLAKLVDFALESPPDSQDWRGTAGAATIISHPCEFMIQADTELPHLLRLTQHKLNAMAKGIVNRSSEPDCMTTFSILVGSVLSGFDKRMGQVNGSLNGSCAAAPVTAEGVIPDFHVGQSVSPAQAPLP